MAEHSNIIGGSNAAMRINCPASYNLEARMPRQGDSEFAREGSMLHAAMELVITSELRGKALEQLIGQTMGPEYADLSITLEHVQNKLGPAADAFWQIVKDNGITDWFLEARVSLAKVIPGAFGTCDVLAKDRAKRLWVLDWKFGDGVAVDVEGNLQLGFYAACALYESDDVEIAEFAADISSIVCCIVQPRAGANRIYDTWPTTIDWVEDLVDMAVKAVAAAQTTDAPIKPGSHCRWCTARPICPAHTALATDALTHTPSAASSVELAVLLEKAELLRHWVNDVFALAQRELENGANVPGWKLVDKQPRRQWLDAAAADFKMRSKYKVAQMYKRELISPTQAEKLNKKYYAKHLAPLVESKSSGLTIVPDSDKRDAVVNPFALLANTFQANGINLGTGASKDG